jgi:Mg2+/Co2+ transporter CorB
MLIKIAAIVVLLMFSAFFSGSEIALFSLDAISLRKLKRRSRNVKQINFLLRNPIRLLATLLIGNTIVNITASSLAGSIALDIWGDKGVSISIGVMTFVLLLFGEVSPKRFAIDRPIFVSAISIKPLVILTKLFTPIHWFLMKFTGMFSLPAKEPTLTEEELKTMIDIGHKEGVIAGHEKELIGAVLGFTDIAVNRIMVKKEDIRAISIDVSQEEFVRLAKEYKNSKIPVYKHNLNGIMGIVSVKELFLNPVKPFGQIMEPVFFVPYDRKIKEILQKFEEKNIRIAIVLDDNGETCGLVTMEDIIEEVFGEIYDEFEILSQITEAGVEEKK